MDLAIVDKLLTTTRTVRRRLDLTRPVEPAIIQQCLEIAIQAPTGGDIARYHFVVVTDPAKRTGLAEIYRKAREVASIGISNALFKSSVAERSKLLSAVS